MAKREHIGLKTKLASALLTLGHVDYLDAKGLTADQLISLYHWDHNILHAIEPNDSFWNLTPVLIRAHREKSKRDTAIVAKSKRIRRKEATHAAHMSTDSFADLDRAMGFTPRKRKIPSRINPWPKRELKSNNPRN